MDSLTHIAIGGIVGDIFAGKHLGRKAMIAGALFQSLPDIDFVASFWLDPVSDFIVHRGITHSILFALIITPLLALLVHRIFSAQPVSFKTWVLFIGTEIVLHLFLDAFNAYGTGWFEPFSNARVSFNAIFVADPLFSILPVIAFIMLFFKNKEYPWRQRWINVSLSMVAVYLTLSIVSKLLVASDVERVAAEKGIKYKRFFTTPTPFNSLLWFIVLETDSGYHVGYRSVLDSRDAINLNYFPQNNHLLSDIENRKDVVQLKQFSQGYYIAQLWSDTLVFNDLRFGQMIGWNNLNARFAFYYYPNHPNDNTLVIQRGRFQGWDREAVESLFKSIRGDASIR